MSRTLASSGPALAVISLICLDDDGTIKDFGPAGCTFAFAAGGMTSRSITWNGHTVLSMHDADQVSPRYDVTMSAGPLTDPGCVLALIYNQSGAAPANRCIVGSNVAATATLISHDGGTGKILGDTQTFPTGLNVLTTTAPGSGASYIVACNFANGVSRQMYYAAAGASVSTPEFDNVAGGTLFGDASGHIKYLGYVPASGVGFPAEFVLTAHFSRKLTTTELTNINQDPYGTLFASAATGKNYFFLKSMQE